jgi:hypothetical protein
LFTAELDTWQQTSDPTIAQYVQATKGLSDPLNFESLWGWIQIHWFYTVAQRVGFSNFNASTLLHFMQTQSGVPIPGSRMLVNPGPSSAPQVKQPYSLILRYNNSKFTVVTQGTDNGWISGF